MDPLLHSLIYFICECLKIISLFFAYLSLLFIAQKIWSQGLAKAFWGERDKKSYLDTRKLVLYLSTLRNRIHQFNYTLINLGKQVHYSYEDLHSEEKTKFYQACSSFLIEVNKIIDRIGPSLDESIRDNLINLSKTLEDSMKNDKEEPVLCISFKYTLNFPFFYIFLIDKWEKEILAKQWLFPFPEGNFSFFIIELTYCKKHLNAPILSEVFIEFLKCKILIIQKEIETYFDNLRSDNKLETYLNPVIRKRYTISRTPEVLTTQDLSKKDFQIDLSTPAPIVPVNVFISYSHEDKLLKDKLLTHLATLQRQKRIETWQDHEIEAGQEWENQIKFKLESAQIILLLISPAFIASDYCYGVEMKGAITRHNKGIVRVIPIILRPCDWQHTSISKLQVLPKDAKPINQWRDIDKAFLNVVQGIRRTVESFSSE